MNLWIVRYGELALKGGNRKIFENKLVDNITKYLKKNGLKYKTIKMPIGRILVGSDYDLTIMKNVFGIHNISPAIECEASLEGIKKCVSENFIDKVKDNFRVSAKRIDKRVDLKSMDVAKEIGGFVFETTGKKVKLKDFDYELGIEFIGQKAYVFDEKISGFGGLPLGIEGSVYVLVENEASLLAGWLMMKRGCDVIPISFKKIKIDLLNKYDIEDKKVEIVKDLSGLETDKALVVGDTLDMLKEYNFKGLVLRPLIAYSEDEIKIEILSI